MSATDGQPVMLLFAQTARTLHNDIARIVHHYLPGTRDLREIKKLLAIPLERVKSDYVECGYFTDPEAWDWAIKKRGEELEITARSTPGMISKTQFIFAVSLPALN